MSLKKSAKKKVPGKKAIAAKTKLASAKTAPAKKSAKLPPKASVVSSKLSYKGPLFSVFTDKLREPNGTAGVRDVIRHSGSVVILAIDETNPGEPIVILEQQYRHAERPAGGR